MAEDWDLYAVVRSCKSTTTTSSSAAVSASSTASAAAATTDPMKGSQTTSSSEDTLSCLASLTFEEENDPFSFPNLVAEPRTNTFEELQQFYKPFFSNNSPTTITGTTTTTAQGIIPNSPISDFGGSSGQHLLHYQEQHHQQQQQHLGTPNDAAVRPQFMHPQPYISGFGGLHGRRHYQLRELDRNNQVPVLLLKPDHRAKATTPTTTLPLPPFQLPTMPISHTPRSRKRKNQQKKMVCHVSAENLSTDLWAWRKYGQKPIKGSPYPRNYYRCSSSKGCAARKQVERSNTDPESFVVTYTGDHTHPRPTHRNSLAGSTRNKLSPPPNITAITKKDIMGSDHSPSPTQSTSKLSPTTQLTVAQTEEYAAAKLQLEENESGEGDGGEKQSDDILLEEELMDLDENEEDEDDDDDVLIPNMSLSEDFFLGLKELGCSPPGAAC
ncbi:probable WRKY transcription factor 27 [Humulus lupulus]|uniref:probable WRKY transcription factor 27 n=1 Tax=Humulus lupulus TaxID=3486 RepID=UPI002B40B7A8|nr:probable WRKY transcription factor 27 [Humulus lupulus]